MSKRTAIVLSLIMLPAGAFVLLVFFHVVGLDVSDEFIPLLTNAQQLAERAPHIAVVREAIESISAMFLTVQIGLFVMIGFAISTTMSDREKGIITLLASSAFIFCSVVAFFYGYLVRYQILERVNAGFLDYTAVSTSLATQAIWVTLAGLFGVTASLLMLSSKIESPKDIGNSLSKALSRSPTRRTTNVSS